MTMMPANGVARAVSPLGSRRAARLTSQKDPVEALSTPSALKVVAQGLVCINQPFDYSKVVEQHRQQHGPKGFFKPSPQPRQGGIYMAPETANNAKYRMDGKVIILPPAIRGCKNDSCSGSALFEAVGYYPQFLKNVLGQDRQSRFPCVLMVDSGETSMSAASSLDAFRKGIQWMETHYESLPSLAQAADRAFLYPTSYKDKTGRDIGFMYQSRVGGKPVLLHKPVLALKNACVSSSRSAIRKRPADYSPTWDMHPSLGGDFTSWKMACAKLVKSNIRNIVQTLHNDIRDIAILADPDTLAVHILIGQEHTRRSDTQDKFHFRCGIWFGRGVEVREKPVRTGTEPGTKLQFGSGSLSWGVSGTSSEPQNH
ncbi:uncharacterized protein EI90DRAFT_3022186 [Cantharellus anzutake]|uniref:uncharacterized protein n=1 Tax=Cantharellus anzutake TaxID=1750568 RepID=UPI00190637B7|nr:uncharacterized protein EI90DRAFT_3022186 [Cantharellus anzutake]KAF8314834.1 hypothetical protein EI90DRAFT_3022186 [Cantharellus anzutake]